jgi:hypothetical protein
MPAARSKRGRTPSDDGPLALDGGPAAATMPSSNSVARALLTRHARPHRAAISRLGILAVLAAGMPLACNRPPTPGPIRLVDVSVAAGLRSPERCTVGGDSRESLVVWPNEEIVLTVPVPPAGVLRYELAASDTSSAPPPAQILIDDSRGGTLVTTSEEIPTDHWNARTIDLTRWAGREVAVRVKLGTITDGRSGKLCWANPVLAPRVQRGPLVVVTLLDTVRADHLGLYGYSRPTSPALAALALDGVTFEDATSDAPWTRSSVATLFTGHGSLTHGVLSRDAHLAPKWPTLAQRFRAAGYRTIAYSTNPNVLPFWGFAPGFDRFVDVDAESWTANSDAARVLDAALQAVDEAGSAPLVLYLHLNDSHAPYDPPPFEATALLGRYDPASPG